MNGRAEPLRLPHVLGAGAGLLLLVVWVASGSFVMALLVLVLVAGTAGLGTLVLSWATREPPEQRADRIPDAMPTTDLHHVPAPGDRVRAALRGLLARPWVRGDGLVRAASARLASPDALVWTPRGQQVAAPHLWVEWNTDDLAELAGRWPLDVLARELAEGYDEHVRDHGVRRMMQRCVLHLLAGTDVPRGRVVVTAAFSRPQRDPVVTAATPTDTDGMPGRSGAPSRRSGSPAGSSHRPAGSAGPPGVGPSRRPAAAHARPGSRPAPPREVIGVPAGPRVSKPRAVRTLLLGRRGSDPDVS